MTLQTASIMTPNPIWWITNDGDLRVTEIFGRHYSKYNYKDGRKPKKIVGPGQYIVLRTWEGDALFVWRKFIDKSGQQGINCSVFRNESKYLSSDLIRQADTIANFCWPSERHYTYVNASKIKSINAGCCFKKAGWIECGRTAKGLIILEYNK
jgi:hypothetical protein